VVERTVIIVLYESQYLPSRIFHCKCSNLFSVTIKKMLSSLSSSSSSILSSEPVCSSLMSLRVLLVLLFLIAPIGALDLDKLKSSNTNLRGQQQPQQRQQQRRRRYGVRRQMFNPLNGTGTPQTRIIGGRDVTSNRYEYYSLMWGSYLCGAVLIGPRLVMGKCFEGRKKERSRTSSFSDVMRLGSIELLMVLVSSCLYYTLGCLCLVRSYCLYFSSYLMKGVAHCDDASVDFQVGAWDDMEDGSSIDIDDEVIHPKYSTSRFSYDIMLFHLDKATTNQYIRMAPPEATVQDGQKLTVVGFGDTDPTSRTEIADQLQEVELEYVDRSTCNNAYGMVSQDMICAAGQDVDSCLGDSGGPLFIKGNSAEEDRLFGLVSWGRGTVVAMEYAFLAFSFTTKYPYTACFITDLTFATSPSSSSRMR
jgi:Trypsin